MGDQSADILKHIYTVQFVLRDKNGGKCIHLPWYNTFRFTHRSCYSIMIMLQYTTHNLPRSFYNGILRWYYTGYVFLLYEILAAFFSRSFKFCRQPKQQDVLSHPDITTLPLSLSTPLSASPCDFSDCQCEESGYAFRSVLLIQKGGKLSLCSEALWGGCSRISILQTWASGINSTLPWQGAILATSWLMLTSGTKSFWSTSGRMVGLS